MELLYQIVVVATNDVHTWHTAINLVPEDYGKEKSVGGLDALQRVARLHTAEW